MLELGNLGNRAHTMAAMALLLLLREYLGREGEGEWEERGRESGGRGRGREESCTDMESHDYVCLVTREEIKSYNTVCTVISGPT